ncbi:MAG TPA: NAD(P)-dependent oxidoreductase [Actinocrinis sp.]|uniref:NAD-dependent epimerase/dehydratase family protein n=1 Tax=Actinocrinis sp. TaxID=1920516 RepID=UPI002DDD36B7|nr:NAD(P)-dependent oxidoreductase [Actinocrinis sp.]HEV2344059.1 NAD(P)-dependent oxidoreductase [Actinocrinis sp.]
MKVLLAGATGTLGVPLVRRLTAAGHEVTGIARTEAGASMLWDLGASSVIADALDREGLLRALDGKQADAVMHQLTALKKPPMRHKDLATTNRLRVQGSTNLLAAADLVGARRFVTQSFFGGYGFNDGSRLLTEQDRFAPAGGGKFDAVWQAVRSAEQQVLDAPGIEGVALRYGGFYGPISVAPLLDALRKHQLPVPPGGGAYASFIYIDDAAAATVAALERSGPDQVYNIVDDEPVRWGDMVGALAAAFGLPKPVRLPGALIRLMAPVVGAMMTRQSLRLSNAKAKAELGWRPMMPSYREGIAAIAAALARPQDVEDETHDGAVSGGRAGDKSGK